MKIVNTPNYNYIFNENTGFFVRWGENQRHNPQYSPIGPEILDLEVSTICEQKCAHCYKSNTSFGKNMGYSTFKAIVDKIPTLTQIALGIGDIDANPDLINMLLYCRLKNIVPNITINGNGLTDSWAKHLADLCGAVAISHYSNNICFNAVEKLIKLELKQVNIHQLLSEETYNSTISLLKSYKEDDKLSNVNAIVFLSLKRKGRGIDYTPLSDDRFETIINYCFENNIYFGCDSCSAPRLLKLLAGTKDYDDLEKFIEPCESLCFSYYINVNGIGFPCSFAEHLKSGINVLECNDFLQDVWYNESSINWRKELISNCRNCIIYKI